MSLCATSTHTNDPKEIWMTGNLVMKIQKVWAEKAEWREWGSSSPCETLWRTRMDLQSSLQSGSMGSNEIHSSTVEEFSRVLLSRGRKEQNRLFSVVHEQCLQCGLTTPRGEAAESTNGQRGWLQHDRCFHSTEGNAWLGRLLRLWPISHKPNLPWHWNQPPLQGCSLQCSPISSPPAQIPVIEKTCGSQSGSIWQPTGFCLMKVSKLSACSFPVGLKTHTAMVQGVINYLEYSAI